MLDVEFTQLSDPGRVREHNEDYLGYVLPHASAQLRSHGCLFALADGVGGQQKGEVASQYGRGKCARWLCGRARRASLTRRS